MRAVDGVTLAVGGGEFVTLLGPSGSGKTTTLMILAGFVEPDEGDVFIAGRRVTETIQFERDYRGYIWVQSFRQSLTQMGTLFAVLLGTGGLLPSASKDQSLPAETTLSFGSLSR